jgi:hypothetical protein
MKRIHALEWEDLRWFPSSWRDYGTDYLRFIALKFDIYHPVLGIIEHCLKKSGHQDWIDCASGGGSGLINLAKALQATHPNLSITLTDFYPNIKAFEQTKASLPSVFSFEKDSIDARDLPLHLQGKFRTIFGAFHHFKPDDARAILQNAVDSESAIAIFEPVGRNLVSWFSMLFVPINVWIFTLFIRPVRWSILPFIYILPLVPLYILWDGIASILRTYSESELREMVASLNNTDTFEWEIGKTKGPMHIYYLYGTKKGR